MKKLNFIYKEKENIPIFEIFAFTFRLFIYQVTEFLFEKRNDSFEWKITDVFSDILHASKHISNIKIKY